MKWRELLGLEVIGKCFCGFDLVKWEHEAVRVIECENCELRIIKQKVIK